MASLPVLLQMSELIEQIKELSYFDGSPSELRRYFARVKYLLQLYHTQDVHQTHIIYGAIGGHRRFSSLKKQLWIVSKENFLIDCITLCPKKI